MSYLGGVTDFLLPLCSSSKTASRHETFHVSNFDAKARSTAFSHQHIGGTSMTDVFCGSLYEPLAQNLAAVTETTKVRSPAHLGDLFWELIAVNARRLSRRYFAGTQFVRAHDAGERRRIESGLVFPASSSSLVQITSIFPSSVKRGIIRPPSPSFVPFTR